MYSEIVNPKKELEFFYEVYEIELDYGEETKMSTFSVKTILGFPNMSQELIK